MTSKDRDKGDRRRFRTSMACSKSSINVFFFRSRFLIGRRLRWKKAGGNIRKSSPRLPELKDARLLSGIDAVMLDGSMKCLYKTIVRWEGNFFPLVGLFSLLIQERPFRLSSLVD